MAQFGPMVQKDVAWNVHATCYFHDKELTDSPSINTWYKHFALGLPPFSKETEAGGVPGQVTSRPGLPTYRLKVTGEK